MDYKYIFKCLVRLLNWNEININIKKHTKAHSKEGTLLDLSIFGRLISKLSVLSAFYFNSIHTLICICWGSALFGVFKFNWIWTFYVQLFIPQRSYQFNLFEKKRKTMLRAIGLVLDFFQISSFLNLFEHYFPTHYKFIQFS